MPLANLLGDSTECLAEHLGDTIGGLLNATFGNAVEIVVMIMALNTARTADEAERETLLTVVQTSLIGSIFSNSLLVLGCSFIANGFYFKEAEFNVIAASENVSLLLLAAFVMILPGPYSNHVGSGSADSLLVSRAAAIILLLLYICLLSFVLFTHADDMGAVHSNSDGDSKAESEDSVQKELTQKLLRDRERRVIADDFENQNQSSERVIHPAFRVADDSGDEEKVNSDESKGDDDGDEAELSFVGSMVMLLLCTVMVSVLSEFLVASIDGMAQKCKMSPAFIGIILLPIIGNAVEHITAIRMAVQGRMDVAISIAIGSATQVAMLVVSVAVLIAWAMGLDLDLAFNPFEVNLFLYSTIIIFTLISDGKSNWLEGAMLLGLYVLIAISVWPQDYSG